MLDLHRKVCDELCHHWWNLTFGVEGVCSSGKVCVKLFDNFFKNVFLGYPIFLIHRNYFKKSSEWTQHLFFLSTGMFMSWWAIGGKKSIIIILLSFDYLENVPNVSEEALMHSCICVIATYLILRSLGGNFTAAMICFILNLGYLFIGKAGKQEFVPFKTHFQGSMVFQATYATHHEIMISHGPCLSAWFVWGWSVWPWMCMMEPRKR